jgi:hypothetical protein
MEEETVEEEANGVKVGQRPLTLRREQLRKTRRC